MNLLRIEHVRASDFDTSNSTREHKISNQPRSDDGMTYRKIYSRIQNLSLRKIFGGVCHGDNIIQISDTKFYATNSQNRRKYISTTSKLT